MLKNTDLSVIIPTYNEHENILKLVEVIRGKLPHSLFTEIVIVDDNSPDGTGRLMSGYIENPPAIDSAVVNTSKDHEGYTVNKSKSTVKLINRDSKHGLISALLQGIKSSSGKYILVMDADFSHPPETVPILVDELLRDPDCIVIASRYMAGGSIKGWTFRRKLLSRLAAKIAIHGLKLCNVRDPISGFFAFPRHIIDNIGFDTYGYKLLLEILVKAKDVKVKEVPYTFIDRKSGKSKLDSQVIFDYLNSVWYLYRYGRQSKKATKSITEKRKSVLFLSKAGRFYTVGASGLLLNFVVSTLLTQGAISNLWYLEASIIGIILSITSNFFLNKIWTFEDRIFSENTLGQYVTFVGLSTVGAIVQLLLLYAFVQSGFEYGISLIFAVAAASVSNFLLNKKWTFHEKVWG